MSSGKVLITGSGMVASALAGAAPRFGYAPLVLGHEQMDVTSEAAVLLAVRETSPEIVFHTAALTKVNYCQEHPQEAMAVNRCGTAYVVQAASDVQAVVVYFSTDYVFSGEGKQPWLEGDQTSPVNAYGESKLAGEEIVKGYEKGSVIRTSGVFGGRSDGQEERNFVKAIAVKLASGADSIPVVHNQRTALTYAPHLAAMVYRMLKEGLPALVHLTSAGEFTWLGWARLIAEAAGADPGRLTGVNSEELDDGAPRPAHSVLGSSLLSARTLIASHSASEGIHLYVRALMDQPGSLTPN